MPSGGCSRVDGLPRVAIQAMNVGIVGLGAVGGSLGLDLRAKGHWVLGASRQAATCQHALACGAADRASTDLSALAAAELVFVCTPLAALAPTVAALAPHLEPSTIVTDVGSVKAAILEAVAPLWPNFVGGHPMAGTAESGLAAARAGLFAGAPYALTPTESTPPASCRQVAALAESLGSQVLHCSPQAHDRAVAWISHLPVMVSAALLQACASERDATVQPLAQTLASSGFRDTSRVGAGNPELGVMMARYNRQALLASLQQYRRSLDALIACIEREEWQALERWLQSAQAIGSAFDSRGG